MNLPTLDLSILKTVITDSNYSLQFCKTYKNDLFVKPLQRFAKYVIEYVKAYQSLPTKRVLIERNCNDDDVDNYISAVYERLDKIDYDVNEFSFDLEKIKRRYMEAAVLKIKDSIPQEEIESGSLDPAIAIKKLELAIQSIKSVDGGQTYIQRSIKDHVEIFKEDLGAKEKDKTLSRGILTHYSAVDYATNGFKKSDMFIIGGETGMGKSTLLNNMGIQMWMQNNTFGTPPDEYTRGYNVLYFSLEMPYEQCFNRTLARMANVSQTSLTRGQLTNSEKDRVEIALRFMQEYPYHFQIVDIPRGVTQEQIELRYHEAKVNFNPDVVIVDYLGLMSGGKDNGKDDWLKLGDIAAELHEFARAHNVVVGTAVQLTDIKRGQNNKTRDQQVGVHRIGRSSHIMHHATFGLQIVSRPDEFSFDDMEIESIKNRNGPKIKASLGRNFANALLIDRPYVPDHNSGSNSASSTVDLTSLLANANISSTNNEVEDLDEN